MRGSMSIKRRPHQAFKWFAYGAVWSNVGGSLLHPSGTASAQVPAAVGQETSYR